MKIAYLFIYLSVYLLINGKLLSLKYVSHTWNFVDSSKRSQNSKGSNNCEIIPIDSDGFLDHPEEKSIDCHG